MSSKEVQYDIIEGVSAGALNTEFLAVFEKGNEAEGVRIME